jgi:hypothetical protein
MCVIYIEEAGFMRAITVRELIIALKEIKKPNALVGISTDSEGNSFSLISNEQFVAEGFMSPELGYNEFCETQEKGTKPAIVLFGTN